MSLAFALALASPYRTAITADPHGSLIGLVAGGALGLPTLDGNVAVQRHLTDAVGLLARADVSHTRVSLLGYTHVSLRVGPRFALRRRGLHDWNVRPFLLGGVSVIAAGEPLARYGTMGAGAEIGRTWVWGRFVMDLGAGLYSAVNLGASGPGPLGEAPGPLLPIKPSFHGGIGVAL